MGRLREATAAKAEQRLRTITDRRTSDDGEYVDLGNPIVVGVATVLVRIAELGKDGT